MISDYDEAREGRQLSVMFDLLGTVASFPAWMNRPEVLKPVPKEKEGSGKLSSAGEPEAPEKEISP